MGEELFDWHANFARGPQQYPPGKWSTWVINAGRGYGKTRTGAENVRSWATALPDQRIAIVARTSSDVRDVMIEGESGILNISPPWERPEYEPSKRRLTWSNGSIATTFTADEPDLLRGPQFHKAWADELASWRFLQEAWDNLQLALRLGDDPRCVVTTTPKPIKLLRKLLKDPTTVVTGGSTYENKANLAASFFDNVTRLYEGTTTGRQELFAELLDEAEGALWKRKDIDSCRVSEHPDLDRLVVAIDVAVTSNEQSDETGIVVAGRARVNDRHHFYILADGSGRYTPLQWARKAISLHDHYDGDRIVGEVNNGGDLIETTLRTIDEDIPYKSVHASRGKAARAEPVAALYEQNRVHHCGLFEEMEDQMCLVTGTLVETSRGQIPIEGVRNSDQVMTRNGWAPVAWAGQTGMASSLVTVYSGDRSITATPDHPIWTENRGFVPAKSVSATDLLRVRPNQANTALRLLGAVVGTTGWFAATIGMRKALCCIARSGKRTLVRLRAVSRSITETIIRATTGSKILCHSLVRNIPTSILEQIRELQSSSSITERLSSVIGRRSQSESLLASIAGRPTGRTQRAHSSVLENVEGRRVYNLSVEPGHLPEFYANGILVHNCNWEPASNMRSPDRLDALVWAISELMEAHDDKVTSLGPGADKDRDSPWTGL